MNYSMQPTVHAPRRFRPLTLALAALVGIALLSTQPALAREADRIEQKMTAEQFKAAGLDQLSAEQLANLNAWLNRTLDAETSKAAQQAATQAREDAEDSAGFPKTGSEPVVARLAGHFDGFAQGRHYTLDNGQVWRQTDNAILAGVRLDNPQVTIEPGMFGSTWYLKVEGYNTRAKVERME